MSKASGVKGYTPDRLRRAQEASARRETHANRSIEEQLAELDKRPGNAAKERKRLGQ